MVVQLSIRLVAPIIVAIGLCLGGAASAQSSPSLSPHFDAFGQKAGLVKLMDSFMVGLLADPRTGPAFKPANQTRVKEQLVDQFCQVLGGPCVYKGADMKASHKELDITTAQFNGLVEVLQSTMAAQNIPFSAQNHLLAQLAHMHRDVVTVK